MKIKTIELTRVALDWAVSKAKGYNAFVLDAKRFLNMHETGHYNYSTEWFQGGPIIEQEEIAIGKGNEQWAAFANSEVEEGMQGPTPLIAAMRCLVASKLGDEVDVPDELI